jgi:tRNA(fMet)-specific endonuclease VapC
MLDTNACIFAMKKNDAAVSRFAAEQPSGVAISAITEAELWFCVENSANPERNAQTLRAFLAAVETLPFDTLAAVEYGRVRCKLKRSGVPIGDRDMLIAAHAKSAGLTVATSNVREFERVEGLAVEDWT